MPYAYPHSRKSWKGPDRSDRSDHPQGRTILTTIRRLPTLVLYLQLAGVNNETIAEDYALTRVGREPLREKIMARLSVEPLFASNNEAALNMFACRSVNPIHQSM
jgi:hypothetical protein